MIKFIAALDSKNGIADEHGLPWQGKLPTDVKFYHEMLKTGIILMGYGVYKELSKPYEGGINYVATRDPNANLREGFRQVSDARKFMMEAKGDLWNAGGAILFESTLDLADELYLTRIDHDFHCTKFFPEFENDFELFSKTQPQTENGLTFHFEIWRSKLK